MLPFIVALNLGNALDIALMGVPCTFRQGRAPVLTA